MMRSLVYRLKPKLTDRQTSLLRFSYNTIRNPKNVQSHYNQFLYDRNVLKTKAIDFVPPVFVATITDNCNLRCPTCLYLLEDADKFHPNHIGLDEFRSVLAEYNKKKRAATIFLTGGEPLLHPDIEQLVSMCKEYGFIVKLSTNGVLVKNTIEALSELDYVNVSIDAYDYDSYSRHRGGTRNQFNRVMEGLASLSRENVNFSISFILSRENVAEIDKMIALAGKVRPRLVSFHNINPHGCRDYTPLVTHSKETELFLKKMLARRDFPFDIHLPVIFDPGSSRFSGARCVQPWYYFCFDAKGDIAYCCHLAHEKHIGNVFEGYDLNSPAMKGFRKSVIEGMIPESCSYCQRRFIGDEFGHFDAAKRRWFLKS